MNNNQLADKLESKIGRGYTVSYMIESILNMDHNSSYDEVASNLCNVLRNLDEPEDNIKWPLDADGIEIKPCDTVYMNNCKYTVAYIAYLPMGPMVKLVDGTTWLLHDPEVFSHNKPRTIEDIKREILIYGSTEAEQYKLLSLINEAHEIGKAAGNE